MSTYTKTQTAKTALQAVVTNITNKLTTINTDAGAPYATADLDGAYAAILNGYQVQFQKLLDELTRLEINLSAG